MLAMLIAMTATSSHALLHHAAFFPRPLHRPRHPGSALAMMAGSNENEMDWREMRAKLVAQEKNQSESDVYEAALIEQGTVLLGGTKQLFGFALRQQFFHKCVLLLLQHDEQFTKGIILNRPSALEIDGWRVWCGHGQV